MTEKPIRILLSKAASAALTAAGEDCFAVVCRSMRTEEPASAGRWVIYLQPVSFQTARDACAVLMGTKIATKPRKSRQTPL